MQNERARSGGRRAESNARLLISAVQTRRYTTSHYVYPRWQERIREHARNNGRNTFKTKYICNTLDHWKLLMPVVTGSNGGISGIGWSRSMPHNSCLEFLQQFCGQPCLHIREGFLLGLPHFMIHILGVHSLHLQIFQILLVNEINDFPYLTIIPTSL